MPIYEYQCDKCCKEFEELVFGDDCPPCPHCGSNETHKMMSCCVHHGSSNGGGEDYSAPPSSGGGCAGCSGGNCASCGH